jgi:hypothetical protein
VYEDLFPIGAVPSELCPLHKPASSDYAVAASSPQSPTPTADAPARSPVPVATSGIIAPPSTDIIIERVLGADGVTRVVMRQRR